MTSPKGPRTNPFSVGSVHRRASGQPSRSEVWSKLQEQLQTTRSSEHRRGGCKQSRFMVLCLTVKLGDSFVVDLCVNLEPLWSPVVA